MRVLRITAPLCALAAAIAFAVALADTSLMLWVGISPYTQVYGHPMPPTLSEIQSISIAFFLLFFFAAMIAALAFDYYYYRPS